MSKEISYASGASDKPLLGDTIGDKFDEIASKYPEREAIVSIHQNIRFTYNELAKEVNTLAKAFISSGFKKGERIGIWSSNNVEWLITQYAAAKAGVILVTINPAYRSHELDYVLGQSGCKGLILQNQFKTSDYESMISEICPEIKDANPGELESNKFENLTTVISMTSSKEKGIFNWDNFLNLSNNIDDKKLKSRQEELDSDDAINIQYTSGTTGFPKGATLSHHNILNNGYFTGATMNFTEKDRLVVPVPLYHCFGMVMGALGAVSKGATMVFPGEAFDAEETLDILSKEKCTALYGVPTMFIAMLQELDLKTRDLSKMRTGIMAGTTCPVEVMKKVNEQMNMNEVTICYGITETAPVSFQSFVDDPVEKRCETVGRVHPHLEVKIIDKKGQIVPVGSQGELCTKGYSVMKGYWNDLERTQASISDGWMHTGDLAVFDQEGFCTITGRVKDMIIRGGENIYPREIEEFLFSHPEVLDVQVFGIPNDRLGEVVCAYVIPVPNSNLTEDALNTFCVAKISHFKTPKYFRIVKTIPMTITGKPQKYVMRDEMVKYLST